MKNIIFICLFILFAHCEQGKKNAEIKDNVDTNAVLKKKKRIRTKDMENYHKIYSSKCDSGQFYRPTPSTSSKFDEQGNLISLGIYGNLSLDSLFMFKNIKRLYIEGNDSISEKHLNFEGFKNLNKIRFHRCNFPKSIVIKNHQNLKTLDILYTKNKIEHITFSNLRTIENLGLIGHLTELPPIIKKMDNLKKLWLDDNKIIHINFDGLPKNLRLILDRNPIDKERLEIEKKKRPDISAAFTELEIN